MGTYRELLDVGVATPAAAALTGVARATAARATRRATPLVQAAASQSGQRPDRGRTG